MSQVKYARRSVASNIKSSINQLPLVKTEVDYPVPINKKNTTWRKMYFKFNFISSSLLTVLQIDISA
jgi:hypothetical protein